MITLSSNTPQGQITFSRNAEVVASVTFQPNTGSIDLMQYPSVIIQTVADAEIDGGTIFT